MSANYYVETLIALPKKAYGRVFIGPVQFSQGLEIARTLARQFGDKPRLGWFKPSPSRDIILETSRVEPLLEAGSKSGQMDLNRFRIQG